MDTKIDKGEGPSSSPSTLRGAPLSHTTPTSTHPLVDDEPYGLYVAAAQQLEPAAPLLLSTSDDRGLTDESDTTQSSGPSTASGPRATRSSTLAIATTLTQLPYTMTPQQPRPPPGTAPANHPALQAAADGNAQEEALRVRSNILRGMWQSLSRLWKPRLVFFLLRLALSLLSIAACLVVLALPSSLGNSPSGGDIDGRPPAPGSECDPEPIFIYLVLHVTRLAVQLPLDIYLTLSPHGNARQRRPGARNFEERERTRTFGSLESDRKVAQLVDFLSVAYCVLFAVGNWAVWSRTECSRRPAESYPLFYTALSMLCITYLYIIVILVITVLVVFFLPLFLVILRALGITRRLPQPDIKPETGRVERDEVEKVTKLVYYVDEDEWLRVVRGSRQERSSLEQLGPFTERKTQMPSFARIHTQIASKVALPTSPTDPPAIEEKEPVFLIHAMPGTTVSNSASKDGTGTSETEAVNGFEATTKLSKAGAARPHRSRARLAQMLPFGRPDQRTRAAAAAAAGKPESSSGATSASMEAAKTKADDADAVATCKTATVADADWRLKYPLHPLPPHRSTCPICLCDFESPLQQHQQQGGDPTAPSAGLDKSAESSSSAAGAAVEGSTPEPLRLLPCQHVLHASCIDQWLTTVSGRCPICQRPVLKASEEEEGQGGQGGQGGGGGAIAVPAVRPAPGVGAGEGAEGQRGDL